MPKLLRMITSFVAVLGAYWLYAIVAVPLIEPAAAGPQAGSRSDARRGAARRINSRLGELQELVPPEARAQLETPWIIESDDLKVLWQRYTNKSDGRVKVEPCVVIYTPGLSNENTKPKPPIVLYAPLGAVMVFDQPVDPRSGNLMGRPTSGKLLGEITITSPGESEGPEDDLRIVARDVQLTRERISTDSPVSFRYGASFGSGRNLVIKLKHGEERPGSASEPPDIEGIESFELLELDHLHLEPRQEGASGATADGENGVSELDMKRPLEISCQGPFRFDLVRQYAKFADQVDVLQMNPEGQADQLNCELLTLYFSRSRKKLVSLDGKQETPGPLAMEDTDLQLREIEATGNPVIVRVFSRDAEARGERLSYDVQQKRVVLEGSSEVFLREKTNEIHARRVQYKSKDKGRLGEIFSQGPGWMRGTMPNQPDQEIFVSWGDKFQLEPSEDQHLATLSGGVKLKYADVGTLDAERIDFWLFELPAGPDREKLEVVPDRMLVQKGVKINSPSGFGMVNEMQIWFEQVVDVSPAGSGAGGGGAGQSGASGEASDGSLAERFQNRDPDEPIERRYHVRGHLAQARFLIHGKKADLAELMLEGDVQLDEIPLARTADPMHVEGDRAQVLNAHDTARTEISVIGQPAEFRGQGMAMRGTNINVNAASNRMWIDGSGEMKLPMDRDLKGNPLPRPDELTVTWQKKMDFDGQKATFEEKVLAQTMGQQLRTAVLEVLFSERIDFRKVGSKSRPQTDVEQIACRGGVFMEGRTYEKVSPQVAAARAAPLHRVSTQVGAGTVPLLQESWEQFQVVGLTINRRTGDLFAQGPGQITTIRPKQSDPFEPRLGQGRPAAGPAADGGKLSYLHVQFRRMMTGNIDQQVATFHEQVRCVYDEVESWQDRLDVNDPDSLGEKTGVLLTADRLTVAAAPASGRGAGSIELEALENVTAENATFTARANRITYSEAKDWLILEGNGYAPAELTFQEYVNGPHRKFSAEKINFWPKTKDIKIDNGRSLQLNALPLP